MEIWRSFDFISFDKITFRDFLFQKETSTQQPPGWEQFNHKITALVQRWDVIVDVINGIQMEKGEEMWREACWLYCMRMASQKLLTREVSTREPTRRE